MGNKQPRRQVYIAIILLVISPIIIYKVRRNKVENSGSLPNLQNVEPQVSAKIQRLEAEARDNPASAAAWGKLGMNLHIHGFKPEAIEAYKNAAKLDPNDFRWPYYVANIFTETAPAESLVCFEKAVRLRPDYLPLQIRYGRALFQVDKLQDAENRFNAALKLDPRSADAYVALAQIKMAQNQPQTAQKFAEKAIEIDPKQSAAYALLADADRRLQDAEGAALAEKQGANMQKTEMPDPVYAALASEGESAYWYRTRGRTYLQSGLYDMALREFQTALKLHPDADAYDNVGVALQNSGHLPEAIEYHKKAVAMNGGYLAYFNLGIAYGKLGQYNEAVDALQNSLRLKNDNAEAYFNLGVAYFKLSQWQQSEENLKRAIHQNPNHAAAHYTLAMTYLAEGQQQAASQEYQILKTLDSQLAGRLHQHQ